MAKRSLKASEAGIKRAKQAFRRTGWTQEYLASAVGLETRQSIWKFFSGRPIERHLFIDICFQLDLDWEEIVAPPDEEEDEPIPSQNGCNLDQDFQGMRSQVHELIVAQCRLLQVSLDTAYPLAVEQVYTQTQVLVTPNSQRWLEVANLAEVDQSNQWDLAPPANCLTITDVLSTCNQLVILGKPGSGKTTLLQHLAIQCATGKFYPDCLPIFISLRTYATAAQARAVYNLEKHLEEQWSSIGLTPPQVTLLLQTGKVLVLLDGLDEVSQQNNSELSDQIQKFAGTYPKTTILITCRLAAQDYQFRGFTYVELSDFDMGQVATFARKWFIAMSQGHSQNRVTYSDSERMTATEELGMAKAEQFLQHLERSENSSIREMVTTPLLLHLACLVFYERAMFPAKRAKLYQAGLDILLVRWDKVRGIQRDLGSGSLSLPETMNLLSQIASTLFNQGRTYFEKSEVLAIISEFLQSRATVTLDLEEVWLTSETVLRSIALQSGLLVERARDIYAFSHLTFQEYLTARKMMARCLNEGLESVHQLAQHLTEPRWREVILLTLSLLPQAEPLLMHMRVQISALVEADSGLQQVLQWCNQKSEMVSDTYKSAAVRAFYLTLCYNQDLSLALALDESLAFDLEPELATDLAIARTYQHLQQMGEQPDYEQILELCFSLAFGRQFPNNVPLNHALEQLQTQLPSLEANELAWQEWWKAHRTDWLRQFRDQVMRPQNMDFGWDRTPLQQQELWEYYKATQFLVDCLNSDCHLEQSTRSQLEMTLCLEPFPAAPCPPVVRSNLQST
ncbi:NACHT domain-containing protein [Pantanalinema rosaneae CENA516]|uniref:NACHT domain-containing protein n=1 Tax=Pantanalinema rosaneae TaxID=1620701 RepID=UPI003D6F4B7C